MSIGAGRSLLWAVTVGLAGALVMSLEMVAFRLYAPYFGYSVYVWANMIAIVMVALAVGYWAGGRWADRSRGDGGLYLIILAAGLYQFMIVLLVRRLMVWLASLGELAGTVLATLVVFMPPMVLLAAVGPFVIRLTARAGQVGATAGRVSALSTVGSVAGIVGTTFWLLPAVGTLATLKILAAATVVLGAAGSAIRRRVVLAVLIPLVGLPAVPETRWSADTIWSAESIYNLIRVRAHGDRRMLVLNQEGFAQTFAEPGRAIAGHYYDAFALGPLLVPAERLLVLGMGGGASIKAARAARPELKIDAVEIDPKVVEAAVAFFELDRQDPSLTIHVADARPWLMRCPDRYDLVQLDVFHGGPYTPFYLVTEEFFQLIGEHLSPDGLLIMNVVDLQADGELVTAIRATLQRVFPTVAGLWNQGGNHMLFAFIRPRSLKEIRGRLASAEGSPELRTFAAAAAELMRVLPSSPDDRVFTDDHAPVEPLIRRIWAG